MIRLYYNQASEWPLVASVDFGTPETERKYESVSVETASGRTGQDQKQQPRFWIDFIDDLLFEDGTEARIVTQEAGSYLRQIGWKEVKP